MSELFGIIWNLLVVVFGFGLGVILLSVVLTPVGRDLTTASRLATDHAFAVRHAPTPSIRSAALPEPGSRISQASWICCSVSRLISAISPAAPTEQSGA